MLEKNATKVAPTQRAEATNADSPPIEETGAHETDETSEGAANNGKADACNVESGVPETLPLDSIRIDESVQPRANMDQDVVKHYAERRKAGDEFPRIVVFFDGEVYWLADGFYRAAAALINDETEIDCIVYGGTKEDAAWLALQANKNHGVRMTNADKVSAIKKALMLPGGADRSDREIANHIGVSHSTVAKYRDELVATGQIGQSDERTGKDGRKIDTTNIGNNASDKDGDSDVTDPTDGESTDGEQSTEDAAAEGTTELSDASEADRVAKTTARRTKKAKGPTRDELEKHLDIVEKVSGTSKARDAKAIRGVLSDAADKLLKAVVAVAFKNAQDLAKTGACRTANVAPEQIVLCLVDRLKAQFAENDLVDLLATDDEGK